MSTLTFACGVAVALSPGGRELRRDRRVQRHGGYETYYRPMAKCAFCQACEKDCALPKSASLCQ